MIQNVVFNCMTIYCKIKASVLITTILLCLFSVFFIERLKIMEYCYQKLHRQQIIFLAAAQTQIVCTWGSQAVVTNLHTSKQLSYTLLQNRFADFSKIIFIYNTCRYHGLNFIFINIIIHLNYYDADHLYKLSLQILLLKI